MILVDDRAGSRDLCAPLVALGLPAELGRLEYGDVAFHGRGPGDAWVHVGVEYKSLPDVLACITTGRYAGHQLIGMQRYDVNWLLVQGIWRPDPATGVLMRRQRADWVPITLGGRRYMSRDLDSFLLSLTQQSGVRIHKVGSALEATTWVSALYRWWTEKTWDQHRSLQTFDLSGPVIEVEAPTLLRRLAKEIDGIGWKKSAAVAAHFRSAVEMVCADERDWQAIPGIGKGIATQAVAALRGLREDET